MRNQLIHWWLSDSLKRSYTSACETCTEKDVCQVNQGRVSTGDHFPSFLITLIPQKFALTAHFQDQTHYFLQRLLFGDFKCRQEARPEVEGGWQDGPDGTQKAWEMITGEAASAPTDREAKNIAIGVLQAVGVDAQEGAAVDGENFLGKEAFHCWPVLQSPERLSDH